MNTTSEWWLASDPVTLYHGTHRTKLTSIRDKGILAPAWLTPSYETAKAYCIFGIEGDVASLAKGKFQVPQPQDMIVIKALVPRDFVTQYGVYDHPPGRLNTSWNLHKKRLACVDMFNAWTGTPAEYYEWTEVRFEGGIPPVFIIDTSFPYT